MSTDYYRLRKPITGLAIKKDEEDRFQLAIQINHSLAGKLSVNGDELTLLLSTFFADHDNQPALHTRGGRDGAIVTVNDPALPDAANVISEYGELFTVGQVKAQAGAAG